MSLRQRQGVMSRLATAALVALALLAPAARAGAHEESDQILREVGFDQRLDATVPLDLVFRDETGRPVPLRTFFTGAPVILTLNQYRCRQLCPFVLEGLAAGLRQTAFTLGREYTVVTVSIDPRETPAVAEARKRAFLGGYFAPDARGGWHFLTGDETSIRRLAAAIGYRYAYDAREDEYAHPTGLAVLTPAGTIARYLFGMDFAARDLRLALVEASRGRVGSIVDQALLTCYHYDAATGRYTATVMTAVRAAGALTVAGMGALLLVLFRSGRAGPTRRAREDDR